MRASDLELPLVVEINRLRRRFRLRPLTVSSLLAKAAVSHAQVLAAAGYFSHSWSDGTPFGIWIQRFYPLGRARVWRAGENLLWSSTDLTAQQSIAAWLASPPHRRNLLSAVWSQLGVGVIRAKSAPGVFARADVVIEATEFGSRRFR